jgi:hypothetical protein
MDQEILYKVCRDVIKAVAQEADIFRKEGNINPTNLMACGFRNVQNRIASLRFVEQYLPRRQPQTGIE